jgi:hypothetical protein
MAKDLSRVVPKPASGEPQPKDPNAGTWRDPSQYDPTYLSQVGGQALVDVYEGLSQLPGTMYNVLRGFMERQRQKSPEELRGTADPYDTATYDAAMAAIEGAAREPVKTAKSAASALAEYGKKAVSGPAGMTQFLAENLTPLPRMPSGPGKMEVVRPKGSGVVLDYPDAPLVKLRDNSANPNSDTNELYGHVRFPKGFVNRAIEEGRDRLTTVRVRQNLTLDQTTAIDDFLRTKFRNYFVNQFGTKDDPVFKAIKEGKLSTVGLRDRGNIREYLPAAAKEGKTRVNPETGETMFYPSSSAQAALEDINAIYDRMTGLRGTVLANRTIGKPGREYSVLDPEMEKSQQLLDETTQALIDERNQPYEINPAVGILGYKDPEIAADLDPRRKLLQAFPSQGRVRISPASEDIEALMLGQQNDLPKQIRTAIEKGQPIYDMDPSGPLADILDPESLVDYLVTLPPREVKNMRFEDAIRGAAKLQDIRTQRGEVISRIRDGKPVDKKVFLEGVSAPLISYDKDSPFAGFTWRQITDPEATAVEGAFIGHSVGGYSSEGAYGPDAKKAFKSGQNKVYTLRDEQGRPVTTVEAKEIEGKGLVVTQTKGAGNKSGNVKPEAYDAALVDLFNKLKVAAVNERDSFLPPLAQAYKNQTANPVEVRLRGGLGLPQPIGQPGEAALAAARFEENMRRIMELRRRQIQGEED